MLERKPVGVLSQISFKITVVICLLLGVVLLFILFIALPQYRNELRFLTALLGGAVMVYAGYYAGATLRVNLARDKQHRSFEVLQNFNTIDMTKIRVFVEKGVDVKKMPPDQFYNEILNDHELLAGVMLVLNFFEATSMAIQEEYADELILYRSLCCVTPWIFSNFNPFVKEVREKRNDKRLFVEFEKLVDVWKNNTSLLTGKSLLSLNS